MENYFVLVRTETFMYHSSQEMSPPNWTRPEKIEEKNKSIDLFYNPSIVDSNNKTDTDTDTLPDHQVIQALAIATNYLSEQSNSQNAQLVFLLKQVGKNLGFFPKDKTTKLFCPPQEAIFLLHQQLKSDGEKHQVGKNQGFFPKDKTTSLFCPPETKNLITTIQNLNDEISFLRSRQESKEKQNSLKKEKLLKRKRRPIKDPISKTELINLFSFIQNYHTDPILISRYKVFVALLYLLGIRVNELRQIKFVHLSNYLSGQPLLLSIGKTKIRTKMSFPSSKEARTFLLQNVGDNINHLNQSFSSGDLLIPVSREHLTRELNKIFKLYGNLLHKTFLTHSCRVSFITRICKTSYVAFPAIEPCLLLRNFQYNDLCLLCTRQYQISCKFLLMNLHQFQLRGNIYLN